MNSTIILALVSSKFQTRSSKATELTEHEQDNRTFSVMLL